MRRILAALLAVWSTFAVVAVLAWSHHPAASSSALQATPVTVLVPGPNGTSHVARVLMLAPGTSAVTSTHSSTVGGGSTTGTASTGGVIVQASSTQPLATTRAS